MENEEKDYEVVWRVAVNGSSPEDVAAFVDSTYLQECDGGDWVYEVSEADNLNNPVLVVVSDGVGSLVTRKDDIHG